MGKQTKRGPRRLTDEQMVSAMVAVGWQFALSDAVAGEARQRYGCSDRVFGTAYRRVVARRLVQQETSKGGSLLRWVRKEG